MSFGENASAADANGAASPSVSSSSAMLLTSPVELPVELREQQEQRIERWKQRLSAMAELQLPTDYPRPLPLQVVEAEKTLPLPDALCLGLLQLSLQLSSWTAEVCSSQVTPFTIVLAAFALLIHRYTGEEDIVVGSSSHANNPLVLRLRVKGTDTFAELVLHVKQVEEEAIREEVPFDALVKALVDAQFPNVSSLTKLRFFDLMDIRASASHSNGNGIDAAAMAGNNATTASDLTIFISQTPTARKLLPVEIKWIYNTVLFSQERIEEISAQILAVLTAVTQNKERLVQDIDLVTESARARLPNPQKQLTNWETAWPGAIPRIFMDNAEKHPEKTCVVESREEREGTETRKWNRSFTYQQINRASSVLAKLLMAGGVKQEDVVVIYAHRGVELVVAIMGVLKAGATFSVIDPQYPPPRQKIYLSVAKPAALVVLERAGTLHQEVEEYVHSGNEFPKPFVVPALHLNDDGTLRSELVKLKEIQDAAKDESKLHDGFPTLGPDSVATLSFTSGSTGLPKGVRGRHFSLTHFYPWMSERFQLSAQDRFTMLSGIAHDPIQRDVFTPLFFGAEVRIPTSEDIGQPGRLAQWVAEHGCTVTHLTPAMGQLLSANAVTPLPSLRHAFFVGDILTKRDVTRLQTLATNVTVVNMYGTTETQRAVSYFCVPPSSTGASLTHLKDILPAGEGMKGVQLVVVNGQGAQCGIGEVGEIYVRSFGLAEGYLRRNEDTAKKFVTNFLFKDLKLSELAGKEGIVLDRGPRDRMYRTGDLGRYRPDGVVECSGRADDQVKIRGFRIELGEIDTHLSQHPCVRENVTLVRRDAYEEKTLISYFVPNEEGVQELGGDKQAEIQDVIKSIREFLKLKLPSYSVPSVIVPLIRMPLTPNGKVDKNALPYPDTAVVATEDRSMSHENLTIVERQLVDIWSMVLFPPPESATEKKPRRLISVDENFFDAGGHSILATRLIFQIRRQFKVEGDALPLNILFNCPTVRLMAVEVEKIVGFGVVETTNAPKTETKEGGAKSDGTMDLSSELVLPKEFAVPPAQPFVFDLAECRGSAPGEFVPRAVFLTGVTGFLGAFLLHHLLVAFPAAHVYCLVRAKSEEDGWKRVQNNMEGHLLWTKDSATKESEMNRTHVVLGDLAQPWLGITGDAKDAPTNSKWPDAPGAFRALANTIDVVVHNGAFVHWVYPYQSLKPANVDGTLEALKLCLMGKFMKPFHFVSSTSVLDSSAYSDRSTSVSESDDLEGSRNGLKSGYGQSKWVAEKLLMLARRGGVSATVGSSKDPVYLPISIIRPGYIVGDSKTGVTNTDDFLWRMFKGCIQLGQMPIMSNVVNLCPVDFVARSVVQVVRRGRDAVQRGVYHVWNPSRVRFLDLFRELQRFGYTEATGLTFKPYLSWRDALMHLTLDGKDNALYPLLHFVLDDLPASTKSPNLNWRNLRWVLEGSGVACPPIVTKDNDGLQSETESEMEVGSSVGGKKTHRDLSPSKTTGIMQQYLHYLCSVGFLPWPPGKQATPMAVDSSKLLGRSGRQTA